MPLLAAQLLLVVLVYFVLVRKQVAADYKLYSCFLASYIFFLLGRALQQYLTVDTGLVVLYTRMSLLFSVGIPALVIAIFKQSGYKLTRFFQYLCFIVGAVLSLLYVILTDAFQQLFSFSALDLPLIGGLITERAPHIVQILASLALVLPASVLLFQEHKKTNVKSSLAFLVGSLVFGLLMLYGIVWIEVFGVIYAGSIFCAICWCWAVVQDIQESKGRSAVLQDELQLLFLKGHSGKAMGLEKLIEELEEHSNGDLALYKLRVRSILNRLIDYGIESGADAKRLLEKNETHLKSVEQSEDIDTLRRVLNEEAAGLSQLISSSNTPHQGLEKAKSYIQDNFQAELSVDQVATHIGMSRSSFMRIFKKGTGTTFNQYLTELRMAKAKQLLLEKSVTETAFEVGYASSSYFSTAFKKHVGLSPAQYQQAENNIHP